MSKGIPDFVKGINDFCPKDCEKFSICIRDAKYSCLNLDICKEAVRGYKLNSNSRPTLTS